jgi:crotonobetainyl-CoA:carnitine CoA-transferase CaiB-like acyl-CoA transferase
LLAVKASALDNAPPMSDFEKRQPGGALDGLKVVDLSRVLAGPWASQLLADYGADVIKVERPGQGDDTRAWGPPWLEANGDGGPIDSAYFLAANRNKRSITVNLACEEGQKIIGELAESSDVLIENFKPGTLARYKLDYASLRKINPRLVYCSISAYGQSGSRSHLPGYDSMIQASAGLMSITGAADEDAGSPQKVGVAIADIMAGMYAVTGILAAIAARAGNDEGQHVDLSLYDSQVAWLANQNMNYLVGGFVPGRQGTAHPNLVPYQSFAVADGQLMLAVGNDKQFKKCADCLGCPELSDDPRYATNASRVENRDALVQILSAKFGQRELQYWLAELEAIGVPAGPIRNIGEVFDEPYAEERQLKKTLSHQVAGDIPTVANPVNFSATPVQYTRAPPLLGQHTQEILTRDLNYSIDDVNALLERGVI